MGPRKLLWESAWKPAILSNEPPPSLPPSRVSDLLYPRENTTPPSQLPCLQLKVCPERFFISKGFMSLARP